MNWERIKQEAKKITNYISFDTILILAALLIGIVMVVNIMSLIAQLMNLMATLFLWIIGLAVLVIVVKVLWGINRR